MLAAVGGGGWRLLHAQEAEEPTVTDRAVTRGDIVETVQATGTLEAVTTVQVGTQVRRHRAGAQRRLQRHREQGPGDRAARPVDPPDADRAAASANVARPRRTSSACGRARGRASRSSTRARRCSTKELMPQTELETAEVERGVGRGADSIVRSRLVQAKAQLNTAEVNLEHTVITAPIDGIVISRARRLGQTVERRHVGADALCPRRGPDEDAGHREHRRIGRRPHASRAGRARSASTPSRPTVHRNGHSRCACSRRPCRTS